MASVEELATAVLGLLADVKAIHTEQQLKVHMFQGMETKIATLSAGKAIHAAAPSATGRIQADEAAVSCFP